MEWPTHQLIGLACALPVAHAEAHALPAAAAVVAGGALGSLLPDADHVSSKIHQPTEAERDSPPLRALGWLARLPLRLVALLPHRGPVTHGFPALVWVPDSVGYASAVAPSLVVMLALGNATGYLAHLLADGATVSGLPGYPFCRRVYTAPPPLRVRTGGRGERRYALLALLAVAAQVLLLVHAARQGAT